MNYVTEQKIKNTTKVDALEKFTRPVKHFYTEVISDHCLQWRTETEVQLNYAIPEIKIS